MDIKTLSEKHLAKPQEIPIGDDKIKLGVLGMEHSYKLFYLQNKLSSAYARGKRAMDQGKDIPEAEITEEDFNDMIEICKASVVAGNTDFPKENLRPFVIQNLIPLMNGVFTIHTFGLEKTAKIKELLKKNAPDTGISK